MSKLKVALLVSGNLGFDLLQFCEINYNVSVIFTDAQSKSIIDFANKKKTPLLIGNPREGRAKEIISNHKVDIVLSINYLFIIEADIIEWPLKAAINFHGSLLPKYRGRTPHVWAIINNEKETGITAHLISEECDEGDIVEQIKVEISNKDTGASILKKYSTLYPILLESVMEKISRNKLKTFPQDSTKATFFGKRTPDDGQINWNWQKERIINWVRAQASPYPGAYSFVNNQKIIIDECKTDEYGFSQDMPNGVVLTINPTRVKTPNGVLLLSKIRKGEEQIKINKIFEEYDN